MDAAQYLRKSRAEEGMNTEEILAKHRNVLAEFAATHGIHIIETYREVVSGESLYARPEMLRLLQDVEDGKYEAVLVVDIDRLSRGRMKDQGIILDTLRESGTLIITPEKTYDLNDEIDDELAEFKTFMSRREYKIINKRLRRGMQQSIQNGCYLSNAPYGYRNVYIDKKPTLEIVEEEAAFVRMMFELYAAGYGCTSIASHINALGARPHRTDSFGRSSVAHILKNPTFTGKIVWNQKKHIRKGTRGNPKHITIYQPREKWTIADGLHPAIVDKALYDRVQEIMESRYHPPHMDGTIRSPLAGLVLCANCGGHMQRQAMQGKTHYLLCPRTGCSAAAKFEYVESQMLTQLRDILAELTAAQPDQNLGRDTSLLDKSLAAVEKELTSAAGQKNRLYELLETGTYDLQTFRERMDAVRDKISALESKQADLQRERNRVAHVNPSAQARKIAGVLAAYESADAPTRNSLLKSVINVIWYSKTKKTKPTDFTLSIDIKDFS